MHRRAVLFGLPLTLAGCGAQSVWAPDDVVARAAYVHDGPPVIALYTMKNVDSDNGAHTAMLINASQRVIFDPAGSLRHPEIPERNDVLFGVTPRVQEFFEGYHARETYYVVRMAKVVAPEVAEQCFRLALQAGPVPRPFCTQATSRILSQLPGFERINPALLPDSLHDRFATLPGIETVERRENDDGTDRTIEIQRFEASTDADFASSIP
jgi:hypothetical protein